MQTQDLDLRNDVFRHARAHFLIEANGHRIAYSYIRKNACTAFKTLILETSAHKEALSAEGDALRPIQFLLQHHAIRTHEVLDTCDVRLFVYRDPFARTASLFLNKLIEQRNAKDFLTAVRKAGLDPDTLTFESFLDAFVRHPFKNKDPHLLPQAAHLLPVHYTHCIPIDELADHIEPILGTSLTAQFFQKPANATQADTSMEDASTASVGDLRQTFLNAGTLPSHESFQTEETLAHIRRVYDKDYQLIEKISASSS